MNRVLDFIDQHLDTPLDLTVLAGVANFSAYHFHRVFAAWMGETLGDYSRRRRLEVAALRLATGSTAVLEIALATGFGSGEAFARAFKLKFGCTPSAWRLGTDQRLAPQIMAMRDRNAHRNSNLDQVHSNVDQAPDDELGNHDGSYRPHGEIKMEVRIVDLPAVKIAYQRLIGPYGPQIGELWRGSVYPWMAAHGLDGQPRYGIGHDDPSVTAPDKCRYDACVEVPGDFQVTGQASLATLPGGRYAVMQFKGTAATIGDAWMSMCRDWLPSSGFQYDARPAFEYFSKQSTRDPVTGVFDCELCIPVCPL